MIANERAHASRRPSASLPRWLSPHVAGIFPDADLNPKAGRWQTTLQHGFQPQWDAGATVTLLDALRILGPEKQAGDREEAATFLGTRVARMVSAKPFYRQQPEEAEDAVSRILLRLLRRPRAFTGQTEAKAGAYLATMVENDLKDQVRRWRVRSAPRSQGIPETTAFDDRGDDDDAPRILVEHETPEDLVVAEEDMRRAMRVFFDEILPADDESPTNRRSGEVLERLRRLAAGEVSMQELIEEESGDFKKARNRVYQNSYRTLQRIRKAIIERGGEDQENLLAILERLRIRKQK